MRPDATRRHAAAVCVALLIACTLAACGADKERSPGRAATTAAPVATVGGTAAAATTANVATTASVPASGTEATPGVGDSSATGAGGAANGACRSAFGRRIDAAAGVGTTTATTPGATTTPADATTSPGATSTTTTPAATTTPTSATTSADAPNTAPTSSSTDGASSLTNVPSSLAIPADQVALPRPFAADSPWNTRIDGRRVDPRSARWIARASRRVAVVASANRRSVATTERPAPDLRLYINTCAWTPAIVGTQGGQTVRIVCRQRNCGPVANEVKTLRITPGVDPFPEFDGWFSVIDEAAGVGYDMWRARRIGNVISYQFIKRWDLHGEGYSAPATQDPTAAVGARGSGLPLFAGVIEPSELRAGRIDHALALSVPGPAQRIFVQPASVTDGINVIQSLPEGARLRLKPGVKLGKLPGDANKRSAQTVLTALRTYGAIVVDRSITPTLYARRSTNYGRLLSGDELQGIKLSDLEVVQAPALQRYPPLNDTTEPVQG